MFKNIVYQHICEFLVTNTEVNPSLYSCKNTGESLHVYTYSKKNYEWIICIDIQTDPFFLINSFCHALSKLKRLMSISFTLNLKPQIFNIFFFIAILESKKNTLFLKYHFWTGRDIDYVILELTWDFWLSLWLSWYTNVVVTYFHTTVRKPDDSIITSLDVSLKQNDHLILILGNTLFKYAKSLPQAIFSFIPHFKWLFQMILLTEILYHVHQLHGTALGSFLS